MRYELYYWPEIQGRGEFVRLALEAAGADYVDVGNVPEEQGGGEPALMRYLKDADTIRPPFAPPYLKVGDLLIAQTANILQYLGSELGLAPTDIAGRLWAHQLQLTVTDFVAEAHDVHHPVSIMAYYEDQKPEALRRAEDFCEARIPKFLGYFERVLERNPQGDRHLVGDELSTVDLSMFQLVAGLRYAFPKTMKNREPQWPRLIALAQSVAALPRIAAYLASERRMPFSQSGLFRHYPELDFG